MEKSAMPWPYAGTGTKKCILEEKRIIKVYRL
jgi:hypothetical protein